MPGERTKDVLLLQTCGEKRGPPRLFFSICLFVFEEESLFITMVRSELVVLVAILMLSIYYLSRSYFVLAAVLCDNLELVVEMC